MNHVLPNMPYELDALEPFISKETLQFHYGKHHQTYVTNLNKLVPGTPFENMSLEDVILLSYQKSDYMGIFNNAAQIWNHTFYWQCLAPKNTTKISDYVQDKLITTFGSLENFLSQFKDACISQFGSGWAWLVLDNDQLKIVKTSNADLPMTKGQKALFTCDVWEHAYYLDYQNKRLDYVETILNNLINWDFILQQFKA
jgi:Fe-Mn family superoxide dismutase